MASLTAHLRRPDDHGRTAFDPECPICCKERRVGALPPDAVIGRRTVALITAGMLALSSAAPTLVLAATPGQEQEGATAPEQVAPGAPPASPGFDPAGLSNDLRFDAAPAPAKPVPDPAAAQAPADPPPAAGPLEPEPATDEIPPVVDAGDGSGSPATGEQQAPLADPPAELPEPEPTGPQPPSTQAPAEPSPTTETSDPPEATLSEPGAEAPASRGADERETAAEERDSRADAMPSSQPVAQAAPAPRVPAGGASGASAQTTTQVASDDAPALPGRARAARQGDRTHVVRPNESLWSIAEDLLPDGASTAQIAREVNRLWEFNRSRIGTGDRDLLMSGTRLRLR